VTSGRSQVHNFSAGPGALPEPVLEQAAAEMLDWRGTGVSVLELSHRSAEFESILAETEEALRAWLQIPSDWTVLFLQGGATLQFSMIPMNLGQGAYAVAGYWGEKAFRAAPDSLLAWDGKAGGYRAMPAAAEVDPQGANYLHVTMNETVEGLEAPIDDWSGSVPVVCDASSILGCRLIDWSRFGLIYAGAQKNLGPAGVTIVAIRPDVLERCGSPSADSLSYRAQAAAGSLLNTPPCGAVWILGLCARHWQAAGGLEATAAESQERARIIYGALDDRADLFKVHADPAFRSRTNAVFRLADEEVESRFLAEARLRQMRDLKGHRSVGGVRASLYAGLPMESVHALADLIQSFEA
jgi:phosphoserine aminotransferase